jgi:hypothetical protein
MKSRPNNLIKLSTICIICTKVETKFHIPWTYMLSLQYFHRNKNHPLTT